MLQFFSCNDKQNSLTENFLQIKKLVEDDPVLHRDLVSLFLLEIFFRKNKNCKSLLLKVNLNGPNIRILLYMFLFFQLETITKCRDDEQDHHDTGLEQEAEKFWLYTPFTTLVKMGCHGAIWLSERI